jgi:hypothetical protein
MTDEGASTLVADFQPMVRSFLEVTGMLAVLTHERLTADPPDRSER